MAQLNPSAAKTPQDLGEVVATIPTVQLPDRFARFSDVLPDSLRAKLAAIKALGLNHHPVYRLQYIGLVEILPPYIRGERGDTTSLRIAESRLYDHLTL